MQLLTELSDKPPQLNRNFPSEFSRQPRSLTELEIWKATELRSFLLYSAPVILQSIFLFAMWKHFLNLSIAIRMLYEEDRRLRNSNLSSERQLLEYFVLNAKEHHGETFCVDNIHRLLHNSDNMEYFQGSIDGFAVFQFDSFLGKLKRLLWGKDNPLSQVVKRCKELKGDTYVKESQAFKVNQRRKGSCFLTKSGVEFLKQVTHNGKLLCDYYKKATLELFFKIFNIDSRNLEV